MPDTLNKQALINLLIDSPLREPIKINLIDIVNNTTEVDLPKVFATITKELEIYQKATERRMKLAEETIAKLGGSTAPSSPTGSELKAVGNVVNDSSEPPAPAPLSVPPLDLPPLPQATNPEPTPEPTPEPILPTPPSPKPTVAQPPLQPLGDAPQTATSDEDALAQIQKELDSLKTDTATDIASAAAPETPPTPPTAQS